MPFRQRDLSQQIIDARGHDLWFVMEKQPTLLADIGAAFAAAVEAASPPRQRRIWGEAEDTATTWTRGMVVVSVAP